MQHSFDILLYMNLGFKIWELCSFELGALNNSKMLRKLGVQILFSIEIFWLSCNIIVNTIIGLHNKEYKVLKYEILLFTERPH